jgi:hypothetical protein
MLSELPKLLGRNFIISFVLPVTIAYLFVTTILGEAKVIPVTNWEDVSKFEKALPSVATIALVSVVFLAVNGLLVWLLQGYPIDDLFEQLKDLPRVGPALFAVYERQKLRKFRTVARPILEEMDRLDLARETDPDAAPQLPNVGSVGPDIARYYPDQERYVLPTRLGNAIRAFQVYPRVVYGLEAVQAWERMSLILPQATLERVQDKRMLLDLYANVVALSAAIAILVVCMVFFHHPRISWWWIVGPAVTFVFSWWYMPRSAIDWGYAVKGVFDLHRASLAKELGLELPRSPRDERSMWRAVSRMMTYRRESAFDLLAPYRVKASTDQKPSASAKPSK